MDDISFARAIHELSVALWIGGVGFVTTVLMPVIRHTRPPQERLATFQPFGNFFAWQVRINVMLAGLSGFYLTYSLISGTASAPANTGGWAPCLASGCYSR